MLRLMSYNIRFGGVGREERIAEVIRQIDPDIVLLQEATREAGVKQIAEFAEMPYWAAKQGNSPAFVSGINIEGYEWHHCHGMQRPFMEIKLSDPDLTLYNIHLRATHSNYTERGRMREVRALLGHLKEHERGFHILTGDFNTLAPGELLNMQKLPMRYRMLAMVLGGRVTYRTIQIMLDAGYIDCYRRLNIGHGFTFPAWDPHVRLDYVFTPKQFTDRVRNCDVITEINEQAKATDHLPLVAEISTA
jgi:endonuclease/exonuclease/phosphatase family metal-dependent hydrolase